MINICFSTTDGWFSRLLRGVMRAPISHSFITYRNEHFDSVMVLEVQGRGFVSVPWRRWKKKNTLVARYSLQVPEDRVRMALVQLSARLGDEYDRLQLFGFLLRRFAGGRNPLDSKARLVCSEMVALFLQWAGVDEITDPGAITPKELWALAQRTPELFQLEEHGHAFQVARQKAERIKLRGGFAAGSRTDLPLGKRIEQRSRPEAADEAPAAPSPDALAGALGLVQDDAPEGAGAAK